MLSSGPRRAPDTELEKELEMLALQASDSEGPEQGRRVEPAATHTVVMQTGWSDGGAGGGSDKGTGEVQGG